MNCSLAVLSLSTLAVLGACTTSYAPPLPAAGLEATLSAAAPAPQQGIRANRFQVLLGGQSLDEDEWEPIDSPFALGLTYSHEGASAPLGFEVGMQFSGDSEEVLGIDISIATFELFFGVRKTFFRDSVVQPYLGGGLSLMAVSTEGTASFVSVSDEDASGAFYAHAGLLAQINDFVGVGVEGRINRGSDLELFNVDTNVDYEQFGLFVELLF